jgi:hypothetical protein
MSTAANIRRVPVVRWQFEREGRHLTCGVLKASGDRQYEVAMMPSWNARGSVVERFQTPLSALRRHAEIVEQLRDAGWQVSAYTNV